MPLRDDTVVVTAKKKPKPSKTKPMERHEMSLLDRLNSPAAMKAREFVEKKFGGNILTGFAKPMRPVEVIPTGFHDLDLRCIGDNDPLMAGFPKGRVIEVYGPESGGKTTFTLAAVGNMQRSHQAHAVFIDVEKSCSPAYAQKLGVDIQKWDYILAADGDEAVEAALAFLPVTDIVIIDSLGEFHSKANIDKPVSDAEVYADSVRLINKLLMKGAPIQRDAKSILLGINQIRAVQNPKPYQEKTKTSGGHKWKHACSLRIQVSKGEKIKSGKDTVLGVESKIKIVKNKIGRPWGETTFPIIFGEGISYSTMLFEEALQLKVIEVIGRKYYFNNELVGGSRDEAKTTFKNNDNMVEAVKQCIAAVDYANHEASEEVTYAAHTEADTGVEGPIE